MTCALNAANEMANELFRGGKFDFFGIPNVIEQTMEAHKSDFSADPSLQDILEIDAWARQQVRLPRWRRVQPRPLCLSSTTPPHVRKPPLKRCVCA